MVATFPLVIEEMTLEDIPGVQEVERASFPIPWPANAFRHELTGNKNARYVVARESGRIVGYAGLWLMVDEAHITTFAVHPDHRRRQIGERMLVRLFEMAAALNASGSRSRSAHRTSPRRSSTRSTASVEPASVGAITRTTTKTR